MLSKCLIQFSVDGQGCVPSTIVWPSKSLFPQSSVSSGGSMVGLMVTSSKRAYAIPRSAAPRALPLWQAAADRYRHRRHSDTVLPQSLWGLWVLVCPRFVWALWVSLVGMGFDSKHDFVPPTILLGLLLCPWTWGIFFGGIQHSSVDGGSVWVVVLEFLQKMSTDPFTPPSYTTKWYGPNRRRRY